MSEENKYNEENNNESEVTETCEEDVFQASENSSSDRGDERSRFGEGEGGYSYSFKKMYGEEYDVDEDFCDAPRKRKKIKIPLSAFIVSLIAFVLAAVMVTWTVCQSFYRRELYNILEDGLGIGDIISGDSDFAKLDLVKSIIENYSYYDPDEEVMLDLAIKMYVAATGDRYAEYFTEEEFKAYTEAKSGNAVGVGINIIYTSEVINDIEYDVIKVINVGRNSPAYEAGVKVGDLVFYVGTDEQTRRSVHEIGYEEAYRSLIGESGTNSEFTVLRKNSNGDYDEIKFSITREEIVFESVYSHVCETDSSVGIVKITGFEYNTPAQFSKAVDELRAKGINKFIFDVRYNGGGALQSIVAVLSYFLDEGQTIISTVDKSGKKDVIKVGVVSGYTGDSAACNVSKDDIGKYKDLEVAVLCNELTASAAELFVATFRDYKIGKAVGVTTFGKGSAQSIMSLGYFGYGGGIKLTTDMYFPPCGESYDGVGITPDVEIELDEALATVNVYDIADADDNQLQAAIATLK